MPGYRTEIDVANRALQWCRTEFIARFDNQNKQAIHTAFVYDKLRIAELTDNLWIFATRSVMLRPVDTVAVILATNAQTLTGAVLPFASTAGVIVGQLVQGTNIAAGSTVLSFDATSVTLSIAITGTVASGAAITFGPLTFLWTPPAWLVGTTYANGHVTTYGGEWWQSKGAGNLANVPGQGAYWKRYTGPDSLQVWDVDTSYFSGEIVLGSDGTVYLSLPTSNIGNDPTSTAGFWLAVNGTIAGLSILYPIGAGPASNLPTLNVFRLPRGFLRKAPSSPKADIGQYLGAPTGPYREDWVFEGDYLISTDRFPIRLRYVADFIDVPDMDDLFVEMFAAKIAGACAAHLAPPEMLQVILGNVARAYRDARKQALEIDGIERGSTAAPVDSYITCRY